MFKETLREIVDGTDGSVGGVVMDAEGFAVETYARDDAAIDVNSVGVEFGVALTSIRRAAESLETGEAQEMVVGTERLITVIRTLGSHYFLAVVYGPNANVGKGRFLMRLSVPKLVAALS
jgi:predicted regulator of Ras-like GTPase activity (Roadblock/LC7/MglB family)